MNFIDQRVIIFKGFVQTKIWKRIQLRVRLVFESRGALHLHVLLTQKKQTLRKG